MLSITKFAVRYYVLTANCIRALCQTDLRMSNHKGHKLPPSLTLLSKSNGLQIWLQSQLLGAYFLRPPFYTLQYSRQRPNFQFIGLIWGHKLPWLQFSQFNFSFAVRFQFDSTKIHPFIVAWFTWTNHNFFVTRSNQWDSFVLYRQYITSNGIFVFTIVGKSQLSSFVERFWNRKRKLFCSDLFLSYIKLHTIIQ